MPANPRRWAALWVIALAQFVIIMDTSIIGVALPEIQADLGFAGAERRRAAASRAPTVAIAAAPRKAAENPSVRSGGLPGWSAPWDVASAVIVARPSADPTWAQEQVPAGDDERELVAA